ncbi:MAG: hypothetical protein A2W52_03555 [Candidatus Taylorbacteria bacterium RIFCSPHIGHO2_02_49_25]|uniref:Uncharacterized protein n=2 Tax=Candidatus Tayloriibacteriota TaxID=1817919 RepID=A0A1G2MD98_9BACT|nr:MAG: hypothetical protein A2825_01735 [Candidatus Taylorbacteria bacterium RIFCSPHIGHO2_01_FULL_43_120]OHA21880.1 MAG: hypothetical protein A2W52_03555 [Candidatus Taylorbacteria bacterium RIFCSPHIGHO2_02_49_25]OHA23087.1 MAG: hypothetical protein A3B98_03470 [Candidatus Taylorbacteria bacterium RIFCSPHIGHO2_02_FULL_43_55]OHA28932.1 MAG: hypothetical protein A3E92_04660 [Candidatus Taylorbacteria bacterium RIFCSPHIGHO2_12_FULL_42_34]OHA30916.1 MAG: hypothetical protein A3B09_04610 [Candidatu
MHKQNWTEQERIMLKRAKQPGQLYKIAEIVAKRVGRPLCMVMGVSEAEYTNYDLKLPSAKHFTDRLLERNESVVPLAEFAQWIRSYEESLTKRHDRPRCMPVLRHFYQNILARLRPDVVYFVSGWDISLTCRWVYYWCKFYNIQSVVLAEEEFGRTLSSQQSSEYRNARRCILEYASDNRVRRGIGRMFVER